MRQALFSRSSAIIIVFFAIRFDSFYFRAFRVEYKKIGGKSGKMEKQIITEKMIDEFKEYLILAEKSDATIEKYIRDVRAFAAYAQSGSVTKETVIAFWLTL